MALPSVGDILDIVSVCSAVANDIKSYDTRMKAWNKAMSSLQKATENMRNRGSSSEVSHEWIARSEDLLRRMEEFKSGHEHESKSDVMRKLHGWKARLDWDAAGAAELLGELQEHRLVGVLDLLMEREAFAERKRPRTPVGEDCLPKSITRRFQV
ncbi:hypothetical protein MMC30_007631 [Trapelia coarctata]|nr:hypothetical protein [Trapelia coarctata]